MDTPSPGPTRSRLPAALWLGGALALGAGLRLWGIRWGLPDSTHLFSYHPDEFHSLRGALSLATGDPNPHFFNYPSLYLYLVAVACLWHDVISGRMDLPTALLTSNAPDPQMAAWVLDARLVTVACGVATVLVCWFIGKRLGGLPGAAVAALVMAVLPLSVLNSHYGTVDVCLGLFVALALLAALRVHDDPSPRGWLLAGLAIGLAAGSKYNGAVVAVAPLLALALSPAGGSIARRLAGAATVLGVAGATFALTSPYIFLSWPEAWRDISFELKHMREGEAPALAAFPNGWLFHLHPALVCIPLGLWLAPADKRRALIPLAVFGFLWWGMVGAAGVRYARYEIPLEPLAAVFAALPVIGLGVARKRWVHRLALVALGIWVAMHLATNAQRDDVMTRVDVRREVLDTATRYLLAENESLALLWEPWFHSAPVDYCNGGAALRSNPIFARFKRPVRPLEVLGLDARRVETDRPEYLLVSSFEFPIPSLSPDSVGLVIGAFVRFMREGSPGHAVRYQPATYCQEFFMPDHLLLGFSAPDSYYPCPELVLMQRSPW